MSKRILVTSTDLMMIQFLVPHVIYLSQNGYEVDIACSDVGGRMREVREALGKTVKGIFVVRLERSPASVKNLQGYKDMKSVIYRKHYDIIWTNEPVMGITTRLVARKSRKQGTKVIYMVHGFHFYKGAPKLNWIVFYPIERFVSRFCDEIVTINQEDYQIAKKMRAPLVKYIHGIGVNTERLQKGKNAVNIRRELGMEDDDFLLLSVGELTKRKNQQAIIRAIEKIGNSKIHYLLCGKGILLDKLKNLAIQCGIENQVHFLGYRKDILDICQQVDVFIMPSLHEGLSVASLEAMYCGLPIIISDIRGVRDYLNNGVNGYICGVQDIEAYAKSIKKLMEDKDLRFKMGNQNKIDVRPFCLDETKNEILALFEELENKNI